MKTWLSTSILVASILTLAAQTSSDSKTQAYAERYKEATSDRERLLVCIDAIDEEVIGYFSTVETIDQIFGSLWSRKLPDKGDPPALGVIELGHREAVPPGAQGGYVGWLFFFRYTDNGIITGYYLTNLHKFDAGAD
jgi:hypothetical protein